MLIRRLFLTHVSPIMDIFKSNRACLATARAKKWTDLPGLPGIRLAKLKITKPIAILGKKHRYYGV